MDRRILACLLALAIPLSGCARPPSVQSAPVPASETSATRDAVQPAAPLDPSPVAALRPDPAYKTTHPAPYAWAKETGLIGHGAGGVDGKRVTETLEAIEANYGRGYRIFEMDLIFSTDGKLVARHDWQAYMYDLLGQKVDNPYKKMSAEEFRRLKVHGTMTPLTVDDLMTVLRAHPDIFVMTDTKETSATAFAAAMRDIVRAIGPDEELAERVIIQVYNEEDLRAMREVYDFKNVVYTLYQKTGTVEQAVDFAAANGIEVVAIPDYDWNGAFTERVRSKGLTLAVYTVNDAAKAKQMTDSGVKLVYSDFLAPADIGK